MPIHEGVIWLMLATMAQLPAAVRWCHSRASPLYSPPFTGVNLFGSKSYVIFLFTSSTTVVYWAGFRLK